MCIKTKKKQRKYGKDFQIDKELKMKKEQIKLTGAEKVILKNIDPKYKYIARDKVHKDLWVFE